MGELNSEPTRRLLQKAKLETRAIPIRVVLKRLHHKLSPFLIDFRSYFGWGVFFVGAGAINLAETAARLFIPAYRSKWWWKLLWGVGFLSFGLGVLFGWAWLALFLVAVAIVILRVAFTRLS